MLIALRVTLACDTPTPDPPRIPWLGGWARPCRGAGEDAKGQEPPPKPLGLGEEVLGGAGSSPRCVMRMAAKAGTGKARCER